MKKERPILFKTEMVRAILSGQKTMTRRVMKPQPELNQFNHWEYKGIVKSVSPELWGNIGPLGNPDCPYGKVGDLLYVKETYVNHNRSKFLYNSLTYQSGTIFKKYKADGKLNYENDELIKWKPSLFMKKEYARIWLEITDIRIEKLNDISESDAVSEGVQPNHGGFELYGQKIVDMKNYCDNAKDSFKSLWTSIYDKDEDKSWEANPYVWVIEFKKIER